MIKTQVKKWGNSFGIIIPKETIEQERLKENDEIELLVVKSDRNVLKNLFGSLKGKIKKTGQEIKDELREELYDDD